MMEDQADKSTDDKKARLLAAMQPSKPAPLPTFHTKKTSSSAESAKDQKTAVDDAQADEAPNFKQMLQAGRAQNPVQKEVMSEKDLVRSSYYLTEKERQDFKLLSLLTGHGMSEIIRKSVQDFIELHKDKLPKNR